jgi:hypothetical protein
MDIPLSRRDLHELRNITREKLKILSQQIIKDVINTAKTTLNRHYSKTIWSNILINQDDADELIRLLKEKFPDTDMYYGTHINHRELFIDWS